MDKTYYAFPALFHFADDGISISFPDLPGCLPCAMDEVTAFKNAKEALGLHLYGMEEDGEEVPLPSPVSNLTPGKGEVVVLVEVFMPAIRDKIRNQFVKKTLSIPSWLNQLAEKENVNFSRILQDGLKEYLNVQ